jgi:predicted membrane-bound spermidine synthase
MTRVLYLLFILSGAAGLIYESIWTRYLGLFVGHDAYAQIIVLVIFLGGMSAGAMLVSRYSERLRDPLRGYALIELAVGLIGLVFHEIYQWSTNFAYGSIYPSLAGTPLLAVAKWSIASALILPQSVLLGATFPLMSAGVLRLRRGHTGQSLSLLYFANSLGAAVGVLVAGFYLVGLAGLPGTLLVAAMLNLVVALATFGVLAASRRGHLADDTGPAPAAERTPADGGQLSTGSLAPLLLFTSFGTAVASFIYEIDWIRMLALVLGGATHAFELMLSAFILGLALGSLWIRGRIDRIRNPVRTLGVVQWIMGLMALATLPVYTASFDWIATLMNTFARTDLGYVGFTAARYALCLAIMLPATFCAGMTLPLITRTLIRSGSGEAAIGRVYAWNTLGSIVGVALAGMVLLPLIGVKAMLVAGAVTDMAIGVLLVWRATDRRLGHGFFALPPRRLAGGLAAATVVVGGLVVARVQLEERLLASGVYRHGLIQKPGVWEMEFYRDGRTATVSAFRVTETDLLTLATNGKPDASLGKEWLQRCDSIARPAVLTGDAATQSLTPLISMAYVPGARTAAVIGYGSGMTSHVLLGNQRLEEVVTIEIEPEMVEGARVFYPANRRSYDDPRARLVIDDAKSYFASEHRKFDLILSEPSNPWVSGVSGLFTTEFYGRVRQYLTDDGVLGQWIHTYELSDGLVLSVVAALHQNFRSYEIYIVSGGDLLVVASNRAQLPTPDWSVFHQPAVRSDLCRFLPVTPEVLEASRLVTRRELAPVLAGFGQPNSDYYPVLDLGAERRRYRRDAAQGFNALSADWHNLVASIAGRRSGPSRDTLAVLPETPRIRAGALSARLRQWEGRPRDTTVADPELQNAAFTTEQWAAWMEEGKAPSSWRLWLDQMLWVSRFRNGGQAGIADEEFFRSAMRYAERLQAPAAVRDIVALRHAMATWDFPRAAGAADRIIPVVLGGARLIPGDELRDAAVFAKLHVGDARGARVALDSLRKFTVRSPDDLRARMLEAYVELAEGRAATATRSP